MDEYISREATAKAFCEKCKGYYDGHCVHRGECDIDVIKTAPAADVQPVKHGKWEELTNYGGWGDTHYRCSVCGEEWHLEDGTPQQNNMNFCPRCGSRMDGDADA